MLDTKKTLASNLTELLGRGPDVARLDLSKQMGVADGTLGRIKYGTGNPTLDVLNQIARYFRIECWELLSPNLGKGRMESTPLSAPLAHTEGVSDELIRALSAERLRQLSRDDLAELVHLVEYKIKKSAHSEDHKKVG